MNAPASPVGVVVFRPEEVGDVLAVQVRLRPAME
jgi:hypothetical protein